MRLDRECAMRTGLEAVLQAMVSGGWANESGGDVESPTGAYARVTNEPADEAGVCDAFSDVMNTYECEYDVLIGHWLVVEDSQGSVSVTAYDDPILLTRDYLALDDAYALWDES